MPGPGAGWYRTTRLNSIFSGQTPPAAVVLMIRNLHTSSQPIGWSKSYSSSRHTGNIAANSATIAIVPVDDEDDNAIWIYRDADVVDIYLRFYVLGHFCSSDGTFFDEPVSLILSSTETWETLDLSSYIPSTATAVILEVDPNGVAWGVRPYGSSDDRTGVGNYTSVIIPCFSQKIQFYRNSSSLSYVALAGYFTIGQFQADALDKTPSGTESWEDITFNDSEVPGSDGAIILHLWTDQSAEYAGVRRKGSYVNFVSDCPISHLFIPVGFDQSKKIQAYITSNVGVYFYGFLGPIYPVYTYNGDLTVSATPNSEVQTQLIYNYTSSISVTANPSAVIANDSASLVGELKSKVSFTGLGVAGALYGNTYCETSISGLSGVCGQVYLQSPQFVISASYYDIAGSLSSALYHGALLTGYSGILCSLSVSAVGSILASVASGILGSICLSAECFVRLEETFTPVVDKTIVINLFNKTVTEYSGIAFNSMTNFMGDTIGVFENKIYKFTPKITYGQFETGFLDLFKGGAAFRIGDIWVSGQFEELPELYIKTANGSKYQCQVIGVDQDASEVRFKPPKSIKDRFVKLYLNGNGFVIRSIRIMAHMLDRVR